MRLHPAVATSVAILGATLIVLTFSELILFNEGPVLGVVGAESPADLGAAVVVLIAYYILPGAALIAMQPTLTTWPRVLLAGG